jgi:DNA sulfur modification protein DndB
LLGKHPEDERERKRLIRAKGGVYDFKSVPHPMIPTMQEKGWEVQKMNKNTTRMKREKRPGKALENRLWTLLAKMDFDWISEPDNFRLQITKNKKTTPKQIDAFAIDEGAVMIFECKSSAKPTKKSMRDTLQTIVGMRDFVQKNLNNKLRRLHAVKWSLVLSNIELNLSDRSYAEENAIDIIDDNLLSYYEELRKHTGLVSRYQFLGDRFPDVTVPRTGSAVPAIKAKTSEGSTYYIFTIKPSDLLPLSYVSHMKPGSSDAKNYQRMVKGYRLKQIAKFIDETDGFFPNNIIVSINSEKHRIGWTPVTENFGLLTLPSVYKSVYIIDGQHRLLGFADSEKADKVEIPVIAFENLAGPLQTQYFVDINSNQRKVPAVHLRLLGAQLHKDSDDPVQRLQALLSSIVIMMAEKQTSPFYEQIKQLHGGTKRPLTHNELDSAFKRQALIGKAISKENRIAGGALWSYSGDEFDSTVERAYGFYSTAFNHVKSECSENWELGKEPGGFVLMNQCVVSMIQILSELVSHISRKDDTEFSSHEPEDIFDEIRPYFDSVLSHLNSLHRQGRLLDWRQQRGAGGRDQIVWRMRDIINREHQDFKPKGLKKWRDDTSEEWDTLGTDIFRGMEREIRDHIVESLKRDYKDSGKYWWGEGVPQNVRTKAGHRREEDGTREDPEYASSKYLDWLDFKKIIERNKPTLLETYGISSLPALSVEWGSSHAKKLKWFDLINSKVRRYVGHSSKGRINKQGYELVREVSDVIKKNIDDDRSKWS